MAEASRLISWREKEDILAKVGEIWITLIELNYYFKEIGEHFEHSWKPASQQVRELVNELHQKCLTRKKKVNKAKIVGSGFGVGGAAIAIVGGISSLAAGPVAPFLVGSFASSFVGLSTHLTASGYDTFFDSRCKKEIESAIRKYHKEFVVMNENFKNIGSAFELLLSRIEEFRDIPGFEEYTQDSFGQSIFEDFYACYENHSKLDRIKMLLDRSNRHENGESTLMEKIFSIFVEVAIFFWNSIRLLGLKFIFKKVRIIGDKTRIALKILKETAKAPNLMENASMLMAKTAKLRPFVFFGGALLSGAVSVWELVKCASEDVENSDLPNRISLLHTHLEQEHSCVKDIFDQLQATHNHCVALEDDVKFLNTLIT